MMQSFVQYTPTKVVFGKDTQKEAGKLVSELGITKVFLVYGGEVGFSMKLKNLLMKNTFLMRNLAV